MPYCTCSATHKLFRWNYYLQPTNKTLGFQICQLMIFEYFRNLRAKDSCHRVMAPNLTALVVQYGGHTDIHLTSCQRDMLRILRFK